MKKVQTVLSNPRGHWVGDGFPVRTLFNYSEHAAALSPFLLLDFAGPATFPATDQQRGVGEHPHRGFETVTIVYEGAVAHRDSTGKGGTIGPGDVQWMTAGGGILHEEFHAPEFGRRGGAFRMIQLWVNLPAKDKMTKPRYQDIDPENVPVVERADGTKVKVLVGSFDGVSGPVTNVATDPLYLDITLPAGVKASVPVEAEHNAFAYVFEGTAKIGAEAQLVDRGQLAVLSLGDSVTVEGGPKGGRLILVAGRPLREPVAKYGPFVMNTPDEIRQAIADYQAGRFV